jgi:hypothetical protein
MPVAVVHEWLEDETDRSTTNYDAIHERLMQIGPIEGFLLHTAGFTGRGFRIFEVWETREQYDRFIRRAVHANHPGDRSIGYPRAGAHSLRVTRVRRLASRAEVRPF